VIFKTFNQCVSIVKEAIHVHIHNKWCGQGQFNLLIWISRCYVFFVEYFILIKLLVLSKNHHNFVNATIMTCLAWIEELKLLLCRGAIALFVDNYQQLRIYKYEIIKWKNNINKYWEKFKWNLQSFINFWILNFQNF